VRATTSIAESDLGAAMILEAIAMTRFPSSITTDGGAAAISPDGSRLATVVWRGDLERNVNIYSLLIVDVNAAGTPRTTPKPLLAIDFAGDPGDQAALPISQISFAGDNKTIAFLGTFNGKSSQVHVIDVGTGEYHQITNHPGGVGSFALRPDGSLALYTLTDFDWSRPEVAERDGLLMMDRSWFPERSEFMSGRLVVEADRPRESRRYLLASGGGKPRLLFDSRRSRPSSFDNDVTNASGALIPPWTLDDERFLAGLSSVTPDPTGRYALLWPYALADVPVQTERYRYYDGLTSYHRTLGTPYGLADLSTGVVRRFIDAPHPRSDRAGGNPVWAPDGRSVLIYTLLPFDGSNDNEASQAPPRWVEVELATKRLRSLDLPDDWQVQAWNETNDTLVVRKGQQIASLLRRDDGCWGELQPIATIEGFQRYPDAVTNGRIVVGSRETPLEPPELAFYNLSSMSLTVATDLNPQLRTRRWGEVEEIAWSGTLTSSTGYLVKPYDYRAGTRYPLALLLDNGVLRGGTPFLLDGGGVHLSGHPIQALAARGIAVLYARKPASLRDVSGTQTEGEHMRDHVESAITHLEDVGIIDPGRVGLSGWSHAGFYTDYVLIHSTHQFAAATQIDGGGAHYLDRGRPYHDEELTRIRTPLLVEAHGPASYILAAAMADRLNALGGAAEILYFPKAPHSVVTPRHRLRSLTVHLDWFCFWLNDEVDPDSAKKRQYERWGELRARLEEPRLRPRPD